ncbi:MAG: flagellar hook-length control protein FliK [Desulfovibrionaceae bacterium]
MQIIPQNGYTSPMSIIDTKKKDMPSFSLQSFTSYIPKSITTPDILEKNQDLAIKNKNTIPAGLLLTQEEALRLRNELLDKKKITQEEANALSYMFTFQGPHTLNSILEGITEAGKGLYNLSPEEHVEVQRLLQDLELSQEDISNFLQYMNTFSYKEAWSLISSFKNPAQEELFNQSLPLLKKLFLGESQNIHSFSEKTMLSQDDASKITQEITDSLTKHSTNPDIVKENIFAELEILLQEREKFSSFLEHSSQKESLFMQAERFSKIHSMTENTHTQFTDPLSTKHSSDFDNEENTQISQYVSKNLLSSEDSSTQMDFNGDTSPEKERAFAHILFPKNTQILSGSKNTEVSFTKELQKNIFTLVENGFVEMKNEKMTSLLLQIKPNDLGTILLSLQFQDGKISALLKPEQYDVTKLLEKSIPSLSKSFEEQGIKVDSIIVAQKEHSFDQQQNLYNQFFQKNHQQNTEQNIKDSLRIGRLRNILHNAHTAQDISIKIHSPERILHKIV